MIGPERINLIHCKGHVSDEWRENYYKSGDDGVDYLRADAATTNADAFRAEVRRLRDALSEIDMRAKQYDAEDMADIARGTLDGLTIAEMAARAALAEDKL
jgi:hypothetical protein